MTEKKKLYHKMECKDILQQGEEAKYGLLISQENFSMESDNFQVELSWGFNGDSLTITKDEMIFGVDGYAYFIFDTTPMSGRINVKCTYWVPDMDCPDGLRTEVDEQLLCFVVTVPLPQFACAPAQMCDRKVTYQRSEQSDVANQYEYLASVEGDRFITKDTEFILVLRQITNND